MFWLQPSEICVPMEAAQPLWGPGEASGPTSNLKERGVLLAEGGLGVRGREDSQYKDSTKKSPAYLGGMIGLKYSRRG